MGDRVDWRVDCVLQFYQPPFLYTECVVGGEVRGRRAVREEAGGWKMGQRGAGIAADDWIVTDGRYPWVPKPRPHDTDRDFEAQGRAGAHSE